MASVEPNSEKIKMKASTFLKCSPPDSSLQKAYAKRFALRLRENDSISGIKKNAWLTYAAIVAIFIILLIYSKVKHKKQMFLTPILNILR
jgi:hypothetical protein